MVVSSGRVGIAGRDDIEERFVMGGGEAEVRVWWCGGFDACFGELQDVETAT